MDNLVWLLEIDALNGADVPEMLRFSDGKYADVSGPYRDRIKDPGLYTTAVFGLSFIPGGGGGFGNVVLVNADGGLNDLVDYAVDGRAARLKLAYPNGTVYSVLNAICRKFDFNGNTIKVVLLDPRKDLEQPHPQALYAGAGDDYWTSVVLLAPMTGANAATIFFDVKAHALTAAGDAKTSATQSRFGAGAGYFDGTGDYVSTPHATDLSLAGDLSGGGLQQWTIDGWAYRTASSGTILNKDGVSGAYYPQYKVAIDAAGKMEFSWGNPANANPAEAQALLSPAALPINAWTWYEVTRSGNTIYLFVDGALVASAVMTVPMVASAGRPLTIGQQPSGLAYTGYLNDLRITRGVARHVAGYTPPTASATSGLEGTAADLLGMAKPRVYGKISNASPVLVSAALLIYQIHDGSGASVSAVYDRGVAITAGAAYTSQADMMANAPSPGQYRAWNGYFRLGSRSVGQLTVDADAGVTLLGSVFEAVAAEAGYVTDSGDVAALNAVGAVGIFYSEKTPTTDFLDRLAQSAGGYWYADDAGVLRIRQLVAPSTPAFTLGDAQIVSLRRTSTGAGEKGLPVYRTTLKADRVETTQNETAATAAAALAARVGQQYRSAFYEDSTVKTRHLLAEELVIETALRSMTDAQTQANRLGALVASRRDIVEVEVYLTAGRLSLLAIGTEVKLQTKDLGYTAGRNFVALGFALDAQRRRGILNLWG